MANEEIINPEEQVCQCGDDYNRFCSLCSPWRMQKVQRRQEKYRKPERKMLKEVPPMKSNKLDKKRFHQAKLLLQKALGKRLTNRQFMDYVEVRAKKLEQQRREIATFGPEGKKEPTAEEKIRAANQAALQEPQK